MHKLQRSMDIFEKYPINQMLSVVLFLLSSPLRTVFIAQWSCPSPLHVRFSIKMQTTRHLYILHFVPKLLHQRCYEIGIAIFPSMSK